MIKNYLSIVVVLLLVLAACDPCDDCDSIDYEPTVTFEFINADSLQFLEDSLVVLSEVSSDLDSIVTFNTDTLEDLRDSLDVIIVLIEEDGEPLEDAQISIEESILFYEADSSENAEKLVVVDSIDSTYTVIESTLSSGLNYISQIRAVETNTSLFFSDDADENGFIDSLSEWSIPLSYDGAFFQYEVSVAFPTVDSMDIIELAYDLYQEVDDERNVLIRAENIRIVNEANFVFLDSMETSCEETCTDTDAVFTFYF